MLRSALTDDEWRALVAAFGGRRIAVYRGTYESPAKPRVFDLAERGLSNAEIARELKCSERHVRRVLSLVGPQAKVEIVLRLTTDEEKRIARLAAVRGVPIREFIRRAALEAHATEG